MFDGPMLRLIARDIGFVAFQALPTFVINQSESSANWRQSAISIVLTKKQSVFGAR